MIWLLLACTSDAYEEPRVPGPGVEDCFDGLDNDGDSLVDCEDRDCMNPTDCPEDCFDGRDNDGDYRVDSNDPDCWGPEVCDDGYDNDGDGFSDCADTDCATEPGCQEDCFDGLDNDRDWHVDCEDTDCQDQPPCVEACSDGVDNNDDGLVDCLDPECASEPECTEDCFDGVDNDQDGLVDCEDGECAGICTERSCEDGLDDDLDGETDCEDSDCWGIGRCASSLALHIETGSGQLYEGRWGGHWSGTGSGAQTVWTLEELRGRARIATAMGTHSCSWSAGQLELGHASSAYGSGAAWMKASSVSSTGACFGAVNSADFAYSGAAVPFSARSPWQLSGSTWVRYTTVSSSSSVHHSGTWTTRQKTRQLNIQPGGWWLQETP